MKHTLSINLKNETSELNQGESLLVEGLTDNDVDVVKVAFDEQEVYRCTKSFADVVKRYKGASHASSSVEITRIVDAELWRQGEVVNPDTIKRFKVFAYVEWAENDKLCYQIKVNYQNDGAFEYRMNLS